ILADLDRPATFVAAEGEWTLDVVEGLMNHRWDVVRDDLRPHVLAALHEHADLAGDVLLALQAPNERRPSVWLWRPDDDLAYRVD
ncbi:MAG: hypothetical protein KC656_25800, partial [Myxococcales bacterium]|nr:hypothetical protein [Myxococcales bacterium]